MYMVHLNLILIIPQLWMMRGQIEEQQGNTDAAREIYNRAVSTLSIRCTHTCTHCWCNDGTLFVCLVEEGSSGHLPVAAISSPGGKLWAFDKGKVQYNIHNATSSYVHVHVLQTIHIVQ